MKRSEIIKQIYIEISTAYSENLDSNSEPENDMISGCLGNALDLLEKLK